MIPKVSFSAKLIINPDRLPTHILNGAVAARTELAKHPDPREYKFHLIEGKNNKSYYVIVNPKTAEGYETSKVNLRNKELTKEWIVEKHRELVERFPIIRTPISVPHTFEDTLTRRPIAAAPSKI